MFNLAAHELHGLYYDRPTSREALDRLRVHLNMYLVMEMLLILFGDNYRMCFGHVQVTPILGVLCTVLILIMISEPPRGAADGGLMIHPTSWLSDLKYLLIQ